MSNFTEEELKKLTVVKLKELAKKRKIHVPSKSRKDEIVAIIFREVQKHEDKEGEDDPTNFTEEELKKLTVAKLKELAKERNIPVPANSRKEEIVAIILGYEDEGIGDDSGEADCFSDDFPEDVTRKQAVEILAKMLAKYKEENKPNMTKKQALEHLEWWRGRDHLNHFAHLFRDEGCFDEVISLVFGKDFTEEDLKKLTVVKLKELAKERKISIPAKSRKDEIIAIILKDNPAAEPSKDTTREIKEESEVVLVLSSDEDGGIYWAAVTLPFWKNKLEALYTAGSKDDYPTEFVDAYDHMCYHSKEVTNTLMLNFTSIPSEILSRCIMIVNVPSWC